MCTAKANFQIWLWLYSYYDYLMNKINSRKSDISWISSLMKTSASTCSTVRILWFSRNIVNFLIPSFHQLYENAHLLVFQYNSIYVSIFTNVFDPVHLMTDIHMYSFFSKTDSDVLINYRLDWLNFIKFFFRHCFVIPLHDLIKVYNVMHVPIVYTQF